MSEFCAHEDEENESQELARRLHLLPPVCADQRSHMQIQSPMRPTAQQSPPLGSRFLALLAVITITRTTDFRSSSAAAEMRVSWNLLCAYWSWFLAASPLSVPRRRSYLSLRRTELDIRLKTRNQPSRPIHVCEPAPWCCQNFTCPPQRYCRRSRQKINEVSRMAMEADVALCREGDLNMRASGSCFC